MAGRAQQIAPPPPILRGAGTLAALGREAKRLGGSKVFICTDPGITKAGLTQRLAQLLEKDGLQVEVFDAVEANPSTKIVEDGADKLRTCGANVVVTLGGGSSMDAGKAMACLAAEPAGSKMVDFCMCPELRAGTEQMDMASFMPKKLPAGKVAPIIAVPTTSGTASETNGSAVITHNEAGASRKLIFTNPLGAAKLVVLDPELTVPVPRYPTATCGMDVLTHAIEAFTARTSNPYSDSIALGAIKLVAEYLPRTLAEPTNVEYRSQMQFASHMAGIAFGISGLGLVHSMGHPLSAFYHQAHGQTLATMLPHVMEYNLGACKAKYAQVAAAFGVHHPLKSEEENARRAIEAVARLSIDVGTARSIRSFGAKEADIAPLVKQVLTDVCMTTTPVYPSAKDVEALFRKAWEDERLYPSAPAAKL